MPTIHQHIAVKFVEAGVIHCPIRHIISDVGRYSGRSNNFPDWGGQYFFDDSGIRFGEDRRGNIYHLSLVMPARQEEQGISGGWCNLDGWQIVSAMKSAGKLPNNKCHLHPLNIDGLGRRCPRPKAG